MSILINCFRKMTQESSKNELKGYKVTNAERTRRFGIACRNFEELKRKAYVKLNIPKEEQQSVTVCLVDGSEIDEEYFFTLEPQTVLIIQRAGEKLLSDADILYNTLRQVNLEFLTTGDVVSRFLSENLKTKVSIFNKALNRDDAKTLLSSRDDHPEWFKHLETTASTKEAYMHRRCQDRIRSYLYKTVDQLKSSELYLKNDTARRHLTNVIAYFKLQLREDHCLGFYFDRSYAKVDKKRVDLSRNSEGSTPGEGEDESDCVFVCGYDHCPCKVQPTSSCVGQRLLKDIFFANDEEKIDTETDELDARRIRSPSRTAKDDDDARGDHSPYKISGIDAELRFPLCDRRGEFYCQGVWNSDRCAYGQRHCINPYRSYEELVLFSTWNFDHRIERSRTLIPNLLKASEQDKISQKDVRYFYDNIFTIKNLRLVHIICHDKGAHLQ